MYVIPMRTYTKIELKVKRESHLKLYAIPMRAYIDVLKKGPFGKFETAWRKRAYRA